jgi:hypothetical protein
MTKDITPYRPQFNEIELLRKVLETDYIVLRRTAEAACRDKGVPGSGEDVLHQVLLTRFTRIMYRGTAFKSPPEDPTPAAVISLMKREIVDDLYSRAGSLARTNLRRGLREGKYAGLMEIVTPLKSKIDIVDRLGLLDKHKKILPKKQLEAVNLKIEELRNDGPPLSKGQRQNLSNAIKRLQDILLRKV